VPDGNRSSLESDHHKGDLTDEQRDDMARRLGLTGDHTDDDQSGD
jgi:hypothetical protein